MATSPKKPLKAAVHDIAKAARAAAKTHGVKRSITIIKGEAVSKDKPTRIRIVKN